MTNTAEYIEELSACLSALHMPPLNDRSSSTRQVKHNVGTGVTVAILSRAPSQMSALMEGGRQHRESVFLVLDPSWIEKKTVNGRGELFLKKGVWMDFSTKQAFLDTYEPARRITYFANFFTSIASFGERADGEELCDGIDVPKSLDLQFEKVINDKLWIRTVLLKSRQSFPDTLGFVHGKDTGRYSFPKAAKGTPTRLRVLYTPELNDDTKKRVTTAVERFTGVNGRSKLVVVKRGGPTRVRGLHLAYIDSADIAAITEVVLTKLAQCPEGDTVIVEEYLTTMPSQKLVTERGLSVTPQSSGPSTVSVTQVLSFQETVTGEGEEDESWEVDTNAADSQLAFFSRIVVALDGDGVPHAVTCTCGIAPALRPYNRDTECLPSTLDQVLRQWGVTDPKVVEDTRAVLFAEAERVHKTLVQDKRVGAPDIISVDLILALKNSLVLPHVIRVHDHDSLAFPQKLDIILGSPGRSVESWVRRMLSRSQDYILKDMTVLIVGGGGFGKLEQWEIMEELGMKAALADSNGNHFMKDRVAHFFHIPELTNHAEDENNAKAIVAALEKAGIKDQIDGVTTTYDPCVVVAAHVAEMLGLNGNGGACHDLAKDKYRLARYLKGFNQSSHYATPAALYIAESVEVSSPEDVRKTLEGPTAKMTLPAVLKHTHGMCGMGVKLVTSVEQAMKEFVEMDKALKEDLDSDWTGMSFKGEVFLMEYLDGTEHDVDIVMFKGELVAALVTDNGPTRLPYFNETCACMPSKRHEDEVAALVAGAYQVCRSAGLHSGVYNVEMKYTSKGPRLIEINARLGGFYLTNWAKRVFDVNLVRCVMQVACNIRPVVPSVRPKPRTYCVGLQLYNSHHGRALRNFVPANESKITYEERMKQNRFRQLDREGVLIWICMAAALQDQPAEWEGAYANVGCSGSSHEEAAAKLLTVISCMGIDQDSSLKTDYFLAGLGIKLQGGSVASYLQLTN